MADLALESLLSPDMPMDVPPVDYQGLGISGGYDRKASVPSDVFPTIGTIQGVHRESGTTKVGTMTDDNRLRVDTGAASGGGGNPTPIAYKVFSESETDIGGGQWIGTGIGPMSTIYGVSFAISSSGTSDSSDWGVPVISVGRPGENRSDLTVNLITCGGSFGSGGEVQGSSNLWYNPPFDIAGNLGISNSTVDLWVFPYGFSHWRFQVVIWYT